MSFNQDLIYKQIRYAFICQDAQNILEMRRTDKCPIVEKVAASEPIRHQWRAAETWEGFIDRSGLAAQKERKSRLMTGN